MKLWSGIGEPRMPLKFNGNGDVSTEHNYQREFCGECSKRSKTIAEDAGLTDVRDLPDLPLWTSHTVPWVSNLWRAIENRVDGSVLYSRLHWRCTSTFSVFQYYFNITFHCSNDNRGSILMLFINLSRSNASMMYVRLICLQNIILYINVIFRPNFEICRYLLSKCECIFSALSI